MDRVLRRARKKVVGLPETRLMVWYYVEWPGSTARRCRRQVNRRRRRSQAPTQSALEHEATALVEKREIFESGTSYRKGSAEAEAKFSDVGMGVECA